MAGVLRRSWGSRREAPPAAEGRPFILISRSTGDHRPASAGPLGTRPVLVMLPGHWMDLETALHLQTYSLYRQYSSTLRVGRVEYILGEEYICGLHLAYGAKKNFWLKH